jgi:hypothetical protein
LELLCFSNSRVRGNEQYVTLVVTTAPNSLNGHNRRPITGDSDEAIDRDDIRRAVTTVCDAAKIVRYDA